jgi:hypothetical protein
VAYRKIPGVESVDVSLKTGIARVKMKPGNRTRVEQFWIAARRGGFEPRQTRVVARAEAISAGGKLQLRVTSIGQPYDLAGNLARLAPGKTVEVEGTLVPAANPSTPAPLEVK